jgi:hypothetical protein
MPKVKASDVKRGLFFAVNAGRTIATPSHPELEASG